MTILITTNKELSQATTTWYKEPELAIDLECENNLHHYGTHLSLIQVSTRTQTWIIDILSLTNPQPLITILENTNILKVFHDVAFDFSILKEQLNTTPKNIFDTKIAALLLGKKNLGLGSLLKEAFNITKEKRFQKADWLKRPLTKAMITYAAKDTAHLLALKDLLEEELRLKGRLSWAYEEFKALESAPHHVTKQSHLTIKGARQLSGRALARLHALYNERERLAKQLDKPVYFVINNKLLIALAQQPPRSINEWKHLKRVHPAVRSQAHRFYNAVKKGEHLPEEHITPTPKKRLTAKQQQRITLLNTIRKHIASQLKIEAYLIMSQEDMLKLATGAPLSILHHWQQELIQPHLSNHPLFTTQHIKQ